MTPNWRKRLRWWHLFLFALAVRAAYVPFAPEPAGRRFGDEREYHAYAVNLIERGEYRDHRDHRAARMPGYPIFLSVVYSVLGRSVLAVRIAQCLLGALSTVLLGLTAGWMLGKERGPPCGIAAALYFGLFAAPASLLTECLTAFWWTLVLCLFYAPKLRALHRSALLGAALAALYLTRAEALAFAPAAAGLLWLRFKEVRWRHALLVVGIVALAAIPWTLRNHRVLGKAIVTSSGPHGSAYLGLWLAANRLYATPGSPGVSGTGELERERQYEKKWNALRRELPLMKRFVARLYNLATVFYPFLPGYDVSFVFLVPFWLLALIMARRNPDLWPAAAPFLFLSAIFTFFGGPVSRYRMNFAPSMLLLAAAGWKEFQARWPRKRRKPGIIAWAGLNAGIWLFAPQFRRVLLEIRDLFWSLL